MWWLRLCVCVCSRWYFRNHTRELYQIFNLPRWPWFGPHPASCDKLFTPSFVDDIMFFFYKGPYRGMHFATKDRWMGRMTETHDHKTKFGYGCNSIDWKVKVKLGQPVTALCRKIQAVTTLCRFQCGMHCAEACCSSWLSSSSLRWSDQYDLDCGLSC